MQKATCICLQSKGRNQGHVMREEHQSQLKFYMQRLKANLEIVVIVAGLVNTYVVLTLCRIM